MECHILKGQSNSWGRGLVWINFKIFKNFLFYWHLIFQNKHVGISCYIFIYRIDLIHSLIFENLICKSLLRKLNWWYVGKCFMTWKKKKSAGRHIQEEQWWWSWWIFQTWQKWIYKSWHFSQAKCFLNIPFVVSF